MPIVGNMLSVRRWLISLILLWVSLPLLAADIYFVDAHSQIDETVSDTYTIIERMNAAGVKKTILTARGRLPLRDIVDLSENNPDRIVASIRVKGGAYKRNKPKFYKKLRKRGASGNFGAIAEVLMYHAQKGNKADEVKIWPDDKRVKACIDVARSNGWPLVAHIEFAALSKSRRKKFMRKLESLLTDNRSLPVVLIHMGQLKAEAVQQLIEKHPNVYFITSHANPVVTTQSKQPWVNMFKKGSFKQKWKALLVQYPDRFIFALDNVWGRHWGPLYQEQVDYWRAALAEIPRPVADKIAHGNAERLWGL